MERMTDDEREEAVRTAKKILTRNKSRRISINQDDIDAFSFLWSMYCSADEATDGDWCSFEDRKKISNLFKKFYPYATK